MSDPDLKFTLEKLTGNNSINFLDVTEMVEDGRVTSNWYRKPTSSGRYHYFHFHHPISVKIGVFYALVNRAIKIADQSFHENNLALVEKKIWCKTDIQENS